MTRPIGPQKRRNWGLRQAADAGNPEAVQKWVERQCDVALASGVDPKEVGALLREARSQDRARDIGDDFGL